jgi:serine/threonine-protein kinase
MSSSGIKRRLDSAIGKLRLRHVLAVLGLAAAIAVLLLLANSSRSPEQEAPAKAPPPANVVVPDWSGQELAVAQGEAEDLGLLIGEVSETLDGQSQGTVLSQDPGASAEVAPGTTINFVVSDGEGVEVPDVIGLTVNEAEDLLESHGLESEVDAKGGSKGRRRVEGQDPAPGTTVRRGTEVTLHISEGRDEDDD